MKTRVLILSSMVVEDKTLLKEEEAETIMKEVEDINAMPIVS